MKRCVSMLMLPAFRIGDISLPFFHFISRRLSVRDDKLIAIAIAGLVIFICIFIFTKMRLETSWTLEAELKTELNELQNQEARGCPQGNSCEQSSLTLTIETKKSEAKRELALTDIETNNLRWIRGLSIFGIIAMAIALFHGLSPFPVSQGLARART